MQHRTAVQNVCVLLDHLDLMENHVQVNNNCDLKQVKNYILVTCMDENGGSRSPGETWVVYGLTCTCSNTGEVDCDMSGFDYASYFGF